MDRSQLRRLLAPGPDEILRDLSDRQFTHPHRPLGDVLADLARRSGLCPAAAGRAVAWLELSPAVAVGRLTRTQLAQLARSAHRFGRQASAAALAAAPGPRGG